MLRVFFPAIFCAHSFIFATALFYAHCCIFHAESQIFSAHNFLFLPFPSWASQRENKVWWAWCKKSSLGCIYFSSTYITVHTYNVHHANHTTLSANPISFSQVIAFSPPPIIAFRPLSLHCITFNPCTLHSVQRHCIQFRCVCYATLQMPVMAVGDWQSDEQASLWRHWCLTIIGKCLPGVTGAPYNEGLVSPWRHWRPLEQMMWTWFQLPAWPEHSVCASTKWAALVLSSYCIIVLVHLYIFTAPHN